MNNRARRSNANNQGETNDKELVELDGYVEFGMPKESVSLASAMLERKNLSPTQFATVVTALLIHEDRLSVWRRRIESAFATMSKANQGKSHATMLAYYNAIGDSKSAVQFVSRKSLHAPEHFYFAMQTFLELGMISKADRLSQRCLKALNDPENYVKREVMLEALAEYFCRKGDLDRARSARLAMPLDCAFTTAALVGIAETHFAEALNAAHAGLLSLDDIEKAQIGNTQISTPGNDSKMIEAARTALLALQKAANRALSIERQKDLGLGNIIGDTTK